MRWNEAYVACMILAASAGLVSCRPAEQVNQALAQEAYVWQRAWNEPIREAVSEHAEHFSRIIALSAEVTWSGGQPRLVRVPVDYGALRSTGCAVGLALRIGPFAGTFAADGEPIDSLCDSAASILREAKAHNLNVAELQVDFDCAESKLAGYQTWVKAIRERISPTPLSITALPAWLERGGFKGLASAAGSYVLQVHSLERPKDINTRFELCDSKAARRAVDLAGKVGVPFRVALPTYGYLIAFDSEGKYLGLSAEGPSPAWPAAVQTRELRANPGEMAGLVRHWSKKRPTALQGVIWYRLPVAGDILNWPFPTLAAVMTGQEPRQQLRVKASRPEPGLVQISVVNDGDLGCPGAPIVVRWRAARLVAADAMRGFELAEQDANTLRFQPAGVGLSPVRFAPGATRLVGWLRFSEDQEVQVEIANSKPLEP